MHTPDTQATPALTLQLLLLLLIPLIDRTSAAMSKVRPWDMVFLLPTHRMSSQRGLRNGTMHAKFRLELKGRMVAVPLEWSYVITWEPE